MNKDSRCSTKTKTKMAQALKELVTESGFEKITVSDITEACSIHRQTFYYHFQDRFELLEWLVHKELVEPFVTDFTLDNMYDKIRTSLSTMYSDKRFYQNVLKISNNDISDYIMRRLKCELVLLLQEIGKSHSISSRYDDTSDSVFSDFFGFGLAGVVLSWAKDGMKLTPDELTNEIGKLAEACKSVAVRRI